MSEDRWFSSYVDKRLSTWMASVPLGVLVLGLVVPGQLAAAVAVGVLTMIAVSYRVVVFPMRYVITSDELIVQHGYIRRRIPLADISDVERTRSRMPAPALSAKRLRIRYGRKSVMISPAPRLRYDFLDELAHRAGLTRVDDRLVR